MDCARTFIRIGCKDVHIVYRRTREEMPASWHEIYEAKDEGVKYNFLESPTRIISRKGKVVGLKCQKMELGPPDASDRRSPLPIKDSDHVIEADCVISAIGQDCDISYLDEMPKVKRARWNTIVVNEDTMQTDVVDIFAGGDTVHGPQTLVHACGQGRRAAQSIDQYLNGEKVRISDEQLVEKIIKSIGAYDPGEVVPNPKGWPRVEMPVSGWHLKLRSFSEVELGYPPEEAMEEASRCMRCYIIGMAAVTENGGTG